MITAVSKSGRWSTTVHDPAIRVVPDPVAAAVAAAHRDEWAAVLAATVRITRDLDLAEDCTQDAFARALGAWSAGIPDRPGAWLTTVAANRARDLLRRESRWQRALPELVVQDQPGPETLLDPFADDQLRLIFTCCHQALPREAQIALTLRLVCGLSTAEVARALLVREATMAARITRAKKKIATARIPYRIPSPEELPDRMRSVCDVLYLIFTTGHLAPTGDQLLRVDLCAAAIRLARLLHGFRPRDGAISGLLALMLLTDARRNARVGDHGELMLLEDQDRHRWDSDKIAEGTALVADALARNPPTAFLVEAAIAAVHAEATTWEETDWDEIIGLYDVLADLRPSPVIALNRAIAVGMRDGPRAALELLNELLHEPALATYPYLAAARADFLRRLGETDLADAAYQEALALTDNQVERDYLRRRIDQLR